MKWIRESVEALVGYIFSIPVKLMEYLGLLYTTGIKAFQGKSHFMSVLCIVLGSVAFFRYSESQNLIYFLALLGTACGLNVARSMKADDLRAKAIEKGVNGEPSKIPQDF